MQLVGEDPRPPCLRPCVRVRFTKNFGTPCVRSTSVLHQGSRRHRTELPGAHSRERLRHRQAPNDDDDEREPGTMFPSLLWEGWLFLEVAVFLINNHQSHRVLQAALR